MTVYERTWDSVGHSTASCSTLGQYGDVGYSIGRPAVPRSTAVWDSTEKWI